MTVDGGSWSDGSGVPAGENKDYIWSEFYTTDIYTSGPSNKTNGFSGRNDDVTLSLLDQGTVGWAPPAGAFPAKADGSTYSITVRAYRGDNLVSVNGDAITPAGGSDRTDYTVEYTTVEEITFTGSPASNARGGFAWIEIDGKLLVNGDGSQSRVTGPLSQGKGKYVSYSSTELELTDVTSRWMIDEQSVGLKAESDDTYTQSAPGTDDLEFQSANGDPATTAFSGDGCTLRNVTWMLQESSGDKDGPWGDTTEYAETVAIAVGEEVSCLGWPR